MANLQQRPLSPHLQIYRPQLTSVMSICHRISGVFNLLLLVLICAYLLSLVAGELSYRQMTDFLSSGLGRGLLFLLTLSLCYHFVNGVRHLLWDFGKLLRLKQAIASGWLVIVSSLVLTLLIFCRGYSLL